MATPEQMSAAVHGYADAFDKGDPEAVVALFAEDATVEDPVGTPLKVGHAIPVRAKPQHDQTPPNTSRRRWQSLVRH